MVEKERCNSFKGTSFIRSRMIGAEGVARRYGRGGAVVALHGVTFRLDKGDVLGVLGGDGSGKTTLIRILATLLQPTAGRATVGDFDVAYDGDRIRDIIGYLPQTPSLQGNPTLAQYLDFWATVAGMPKAKRRGRVTELISFFDLTGQAMERVLDATTFAQRRLFLALVLLSNPPFLLLDEPMAGLTLAERDALIPKLRALQDQGKTILMTATKLADLQPVCSHILTLFDGRSTRSYPTPVLLRKVGDAHHARVFVESKAPVSDVRTALRDVHGLIDVKETEGALVLFVEPGVFRADELRAALASAEVEVKNVREAALTIGDIFRTLSSEEAA